MAATMISTFDVLGLIAEVSLLLLCSCDATRLPPPWRMNIIRLCDEFEDAQPTPPIVNRTYCLQSIEESLRAPIMYLSPPVILWSPLEQFSATLQISFMCPKLSLSGHHDVSLCATGWRNGAQGERSELRKIYGCDGVTLLVGRVYNCLMGHEVVGYHPGIMKQFPNCFNPFRLWHITGFTIEFTVALITAGMSISGIRDVLNKS